MRSEGIDSVGRRGGSDVWFQAVAVDDVNRLIKEIGNIFLEFDLIENCDPRIRIDLDHDIDIAPGMVFTPRRRAEYAACKTPRLRKAAWDRRRIAIASGLLMDGI